MLQPQKSSYNMNGLFLVIVVFLIAALSGYGQITNYISAALLVVIIPCCLNLVPQKMMNSFLALFLFIAFYILTSITNCSSVYYLVGTCIMYTLVTFGPYFIKVYLERIDNIMLKKKLFQWATGIWFFIVTISIATYSGAEEGGREFASEHKGSFLGGGYGAAYASAMMAVICFHYLISGKGKVSRKARIWLLIGLLLSAAHVFLTMSTITIIAMFLGIALSFFFRGLKTKKLNISTIIFTMLLGVGCIYFIMNRESVGLWMIKTSAGIENELFSDRLFEIGRLLYAEDESHHMGKRIYTLSTSIETFLKNPVLGIGYQYGNTYTLLYQNGVGVHSELWDSFAKYGLVGALPYLYFFYTQLKSLIQKSSYRIAVPLLGTFLIMFTFNPFLSVQTIFMLCLYLPLLTDLIEEQKG